MQSNKYNGMVFEMEMYLKWKLILK